jgi:hypothetical protein
MGFLRHTILPTAKIDLSAALSPQLRSRATAKTETLFANAGVARPRIANCSHDTNA